MPKSYLEKTANISTLKHILICMHWVRVAAKFFERIGAEVNTCVIGPSRLKVGAKSKKDPHIRVGGCKEGVRRAKTMIMEVLDTTTNSRVTMKIDVFYTDRSHIIGKGGNTIRRVMAETNCHIHFPDSNRSNPNEKSNQVLELIIWKS